MSKIPRKSLILSVDQKFGNIIIPWLKEQNLIKTEFKIITHQLKLYIPIKNLPENFSKKKEKYSLETYSIDSKESQHFLQKKEKKKKNSLKDLIKLVVPSELNALIPRSFDILGSIAIIELNREEHLKLRPFIFKIGELLLKNNPNLDSVYEKAGNIDGIYRTRQFKYIVGKKSTITEYKENQCRFLIDIERTFFTPRLAFERNRISNIEINFNSNGVIWDMFCGVGPYLIQIARKYPKYEYIGTDINPDAIRLAKQNVDLNKMNKYNIDFINLNVANIGENAYHYKLKGNVVRIIMNLPEKNIEFIKILPEYIHPNGCLLHIYQFNEKREDPLEEARKILEINLTKVNLKIVQILSSRIVKPFSPALETTVIDAIISK
ncbi:class I SAM-dependent methyltransferase family protein [Candidatus Lokiarchaeum ossiferum]|uniref:class I SAM-dependent methyltransferase family protein n=1 Tax=Candidatus Lokiarchaeum ossiferum TaxID=2951803 RepID=UPI00352E7AB6